MPTHEEVITGLIAERDRLRAARARTAARLRGLRRERDQDTAWWEDQRNAVLDQLSDARRERDELRAALEHYADAANWNRYYADEYIGEGHDVIGRGGPDVARKALGRPSTPERGDRRPTEET